MKERPILMQQDMAQAAAEGLKTHTRRLCKGAILHHACLTGDCPHTTQAECDAELAKLCPFGIPGDRLWVRETWQHFTDAPLDTTWRADIAAIEEADVRNDLLAVLDGRWKPSIHMPRKRARTILEVVSVRLEGLCEITEEDAIREGARRNQGEGEEWDGTYLTQDYILGKPGSENDCPHSDAREWFRMLWNEINGPSSWDANPWVWVIEFRRIGKVVEA